MSRNKTAILFFLPAIVALLIGCNDSGSNVIAEVKGKYLYASDIPQIVPEGSTKEDSIAIIKSYANSWVRRQLTLAKAEENLNEVDKDVTRELDDYRTSLLVYRYEQEYVNQRMDTVISEEEISNFYEENKDKLRTSNHLVKAVYIKVPTASAYLKRIKELYRSTDPEKIGELDDICLRVAEKYDYFNDDWIDLSAIVKLLPQSVSVYEKDIQRQRYIEDKDDLYTYLVGVREYVPKGDYMPVDYGRKTIISIILNQRKQKLISELEQKIYDDAVQQGSITVNVGS